jgi:predicted permease
VRLARRYRALVVTAIVNLAVAIAVGTAAFSVLNGTALRLYLGLDADVIEIWRHHARGASASWPAVELLDVRQRARLLALEGAFSTTASVRTSAGATATSVEIQFVTGGYLQTFGAGAAVGRVLGQVDDVPGHPPGAVLDHLFWRRHFSADPAVVGRAIWIADTPVRVLGVARRDFVDPSYEVPAAQVWLPLSAASAMPALAAGGSMRLRALGRLAPGATMPAAEAEVSALLAGLGGSAGVPPPTGAEVTPRINALEASHVRLIVAGVVAVIGLVLALASANVSNLLLAGVEARRQEIALRLSLGAGPVRIWRQLATEGLLLGAVSGASGHLLARWLSPILASFLGMDGADVEPDARVVMFTAIATAAVVLAAVLLSARQALRRNVLAALKGAGGSATSAHRQGRARSALIAAQAAVAIVLVVVAALFVRTLVHLAWLDPGFDLDRLITVAVRHTGDDREARAQEYWRLAIQRVRALPGVEGAALASFPPFATSVGVPSATHENNTDAGYFGVAGLRIVRGRTYTPTEVATGAPVAVISEQLADRHWRDDGPVGSRLDRIPGISAREGSRTIVGVVADAQAVRLHDQTTPFVYLPIASFARAMLVIRARDPGAVAVPVREALSAVSASVQPSLTILADRYAREFVRPRRLTTLAGVTAVLALGLAAVGLAGATAFGVRRRTREIAIRLALGARRADVGRQFVREGMRPVLAGLTVGLGAALAAGQVLAGLLHGLSARDPLALAAAVTVLLTAALISILIPLRRALRLDPAAVLRNS